MEIRHLRYFVAVAELLSYRRAADLLHVSQPALSSQIRDLEDEIGVRLLDRDTRGVQLTDAGRVLLDEARQILTQTQNAIRAVREAAESRRGRLLIGNLAALSAAFLAPQLERFRQRFPDVDVTLVDLPMADQVPALEAREIQIGFAMGECPPLPASLTEHALLRSPLCVMMGRTHRYSAVLAVPLSDVAAETVLVMSHNRHATRHAEQVRGIMAAHGLSARVKFVDGYTALLTMLATGRDVTIVPALIAGTAIKEVISRPIIDTGHPVMRPELRVLRRGDDSSELVRNFVEMLKTGAVGAPV